MKYDDLIIWVDALLLKIHAITGWTIPEKKILAILVDQFRKKILESYPTCNPDEIEFAFRSEGTKVKDWGKSMNLSLIDEVMIPYLSKRFEISRVEEQKKQQLLEQKMEMTDEDLWEQTEALVKKGGYQIDLIPPSLYEWMDKNGNILFDSKEKMKYVERATLYRHSRLAADFDKNPNDPNVKKTLSEFNRMREDKKYSETEHNLIKTLAKKLIVFDLMKQK
jgi:hypothetical protein